MEGEQKLAIEREREREREAVVVQLSGKGWMIVNLFIYWVKCMPCRRCREHIKVMYLYRS